MNRTSVGNYLLAYHGRWWQERLKDVIGCPDNRFIARDPHAGEIVAGYQVMHNGLRIVPGSYYGWPIKRLLRENHGVHEPQEERVFAEVLRHVAAGSVMLELGSFWAFYSMWFAKTVRGAICHLVEPEAAHLEFGRRNFEVNGLTGTFTQAYVGRTNATSSDGVRTIGVDDYLAKAGLERIAILHADIQGFELEMLSGARETISAHRVDYVFISTHSNELHVDCLRSLRDFGYIVIAECNLDESYSLDGLIVARSPTVDEPSSIAISKKPKADETV